jgi:glycosyltransferase involved in cell wall biosynthesis
MLKILQVMAGAESGGAETAFADFSVAFDPLCQQKILTRKNQRGLDLQRKNLDVTFAPFGGALDFLTPLQIKKTIDHFEPDIVQCWMSRASAKIPPLSFLKSLRQRPLIFSRLGGYYNLKYYKRTDYFIANTPMIRQYLIEQGIEPNRVRHINNFAPTEQKSPDIDRASMATRATDIVLLCLARFHPVKALDVALKALAQLPSHYVLWLAGEGEEQKNLQQLAQDLGVADRVRFLGWRRDADALLRACDICVFPSRFEPFGNVFVQAWAQRTAVICSKSDGPKHYIRPQEDGLLFDIDQVDQLVASILELQADPVLKQKLIENGFTRYSQEFTKDQAVKAYFDFYQEALSRP